jgi:DNA-binding MarR family transcriptional regulator
MGRGLSDLQKYILKEAAAQNPNERGNQWLYNHDIFMGYYGWEPHIRNYDMRAANNFLPSAIGEKKYNAAHVAVRKACDRLEQRGLINCISSYGRRSWAAVEITDKGREVAASILAKADLADKAEKQPTTTTQSVSLEEIKLAREDYAQQYIKKNLGVCWSCGHDWEAMFVCKSCDARFLMDIVDARICPSCGSTDFGEYLDDGDSPLERRLNQLEMEIYPDAKDRSKGNSPEVIKKEIEMLEKRLKTWRRRLAKAEATPA